MPPSSVPSSSSLRVGLVGYGLAGRQFHAPLLAAAGLTVAAVSTSDRARADAAREDLPQARVVPDLDALLEAGGVDLVVLASATGAHAAQAEQVIGAGLPLVVDKPLAVDATAALAVVDLAAHHGVPLTVFQNRRYDREFLALTAVRDEALVGEVYRAEYRWDRWRPVPAPRWRQQVAPEEGGGILLDLHSHLLDQAVLLHGEVVTVYAELASHTTVSEDDTFLACRHASGVVTHVSASWVAGAPGPRARVSGSAGAFVVAGQAGEETAFRDFADEGDAVGWLVRGTERTPGPVVPPADPADFYRGVAAALASDDPQPLMPVDPRDSVHVLAVIDAARTSAAGGRVVDVLTPGQPD
ncbi:MAG TPA: Gfo/Idh/MocA family oxidoreductase [Intrasporangium sp.]|uniref:Gfo/Idh/MocA family protein n=1 Tax=Intrasporangium sp. TaxID=1925024 RepID=UPI002D76D70D|nr:Gfo/Idh/MocA family oxidoreductase [Intrasporangium sp.]HET7397482.1 Gfo/Idh/MocA family oxidoreductase [Intrasporangium sp.]